jgi:hypothetical protein
MRRDQAPGPGIEVRWLLPGRWNPMADDQERASGEIPVLMQEFIAQLRGVTERMAGLARLGEPLPPLPGLPALPGLSAWLAPGALSAAQLESVVAGVSAQRRSIEALKTQLTAFDEQLAVLERILQPLAEWSRTWAALEGQLMNMPRGPAAGEQPGGS